MSTILRNIAMTAPREEIADLLEKLNSNNNQFREAARRAVKIAREGRYSAANLSEVMQALNELERLSA